MMGRKGEKTMDGNKISVIIADDNKEFCSILNDYLLNQKDIVVTKNSKYKSRHSTFRYNYATFRWFRGFRKIKFYGFR